MIRVRGHDQPEHGQREGPRCHQARDAIGGVAVVWRHRLWCAGALLDRTECRRSIDVGTWNWKAIDVVNAHVRDRALLREATRRGLAMVAAGRIDLGPLVTHRFTLDEVDAGFATMQARPAGFVKAVMVNPQA